MRVFQNNDNIVLRDGNNIAVARTFGEEFCISCYKQGCKSVADEIMVSGGKLSKNEVSGSLSLFYELLRIAREKWSGKRFYCDPSDSRPMRVYVRLMNKHNIPHTINNGILKFCF